MVKDLRIKRTNLKINRFIEVYNKIRRIMILLEYKNNNFLIIILLIENMRNEN